MVWCSESDILDKINTNEIIEEFTSKKARKIIVFCI